MRNLLFILVTTLLVAGCSQPAPPQPTAEVVATEQPAPATFTPSPLPPTATLEPATVTPEPAEPATGTPVVAATASPSPAAPATLAPAATSTPTPLPAKPTAIPATQRPAAATQAPAASPTPAPVSGAAWRGEYFANPDLYGEPALVRADADLQFDWGMGSPDAGIPSDKFSARWTRSISLPEGQWRFHATADDGVRVYVDGVPVIDQWHTTASVTYNTSAFLSAGNHNLRVDYFENLEKAAVHVWWEPDNNSATDPAHAGAWRGDYYNNRDFSGTPVFSRDDPAVYFEWGEGGPGGGIGGQDFSVRWSRKVHFPGATYRFTAKADDGVRVWLDWAGVIDKWGGPAGETATNELYVNEGEHEVVVEYTQGAGAASVQALWQPTSANWVGNITTCMPPQDGWVKVYRLAPNNRWEDLRPDGYGRESTSGSLTIFGVPVDPTYGWDGQPYRVELWVKGSLTQSEGNLHAGQPEFRVAPGEDAATSWPCS